MPTTDESRFCLPEAVTDGFSAPTTFRWLRAHEQESRAQARARQTEAIVAGRSAQGICCEGDRILFGGRVWRRNARAGAPARRHPTAVVPLLSKQDDLIKEVYRTVYLEPLDTGWEKLLADRSRPMRERLQEFYNAYTNVIFTRKWLRIYLYSGLKGLDINRWYVGVVRDKILSRIIRECRHEAGLPAQNKPTTAELELAWVFHSGIFYYGVRKYIYESPVLEDKQQMINDAVDAFLTGFQRVFGTVSVGRTPVREVV
jgi:hypothetical protein